MSRKASTKPILIELVTQSVHFSKGDQPCVYPEVGKLLCQKGLDTRNKKREIRRFEVDVLLCHFVSYTQLCFQPRPFKRKWKLRPVVLMPFLHDLQKLEYEKGFDSSVRVTYYDR